MSDGPTASPVVKARDEQGSTPPAPMTQAREGAGYRPARSPVPPGASGGAAGALMARGLQQTIGNQRAGALAAQPRPATPGAYAATPDTPAPAAAPAADPAAIADEVYEARAIRAPAGHDASMQPIAATPTVAREQESLGSNLSILGQARASRYGTEVISKAAWEAGTSVQRIGIVEPESGVNLRQGPSADAKIVRLLPFNQRVWVDRRMPGDWHRVVLEDGTDGYVAASHVNTQLPEPTASLHRIKGGESALDIVRQYYTGDAIEWGQDQRFYVNVLVLVNEEAGRNGIFKPSSDAAWDDTRTKAGSKIWIPGLAFAQSMKARVSSGSLSYELYTAIKEAAIAAGEFVVGTLAFVGGVLHGALESLWDVLAGLAHLVGMAWDILKSLILGKLLSDARALMESLAKLSAKDLLEAGLDWLDRKWNAPGLLSRWHFRGWIIGYAIVEILMLVFSEGVITALKWVGKAGKFSKILSKFPQVTKLIDAAKAARLAKGGKAEKLAEGLKAGKAAEAGEAAKAAKAAEAAEAAKAAEAAEVAEAAKTAEAAEAAKTAEAAEAAKTAEAAEAAKTAEAGEAAKAGEALETGADASKMKGHTGELASVFRRGGKIRKIREVSLKRLRQVLGKAGVSPRGYKLQKASAADLAALAKAGDDPANVYGWVSRIGSELVRDARGRPIVNFTPKGLSSLEEAVKTFGHEAQHIKDFAAGLKTSSEAYAEIAGQKLWLLVSKTL